jgi:hypothetical protein
MSKVWGIRPMLPLTPRDQAHEPPSLQQKRDQAHEPLTPRDQAHEPPSLQLPLTSWLCFSCERSSTPDDFMIDSESNA